MTSIIAKLWTAMDESVDKLMSTDTAEHSEYQLAKGMTMGLARAICEMSVPFFRGPNAVAAHAKDRWEARQAGEPVPPTPGIDRYNPYGTTLPAKGVPKVQIPTEKHGAIKFGLEQGLTPDQIVTGFKVPSAWVEQVQTELAK